MPESKAADTTKANSDTTESSTTQSAVQQSAVSVPSKENKEEPTEKKMGFFEKWRAKTAAGYEKHRAAGGNF